MSEHYCPKCATTLFMDQDAKNVVRCGNHKCDYKAHRLDFMASHQTRRQWLAGLAMQGLMFGYIESPANVYEVSKLAYAMADAMLEYEKNEVKNGRS